ncbi:MAG: hypothetical protein H7227_04450 [Actinobacteria bacterium]|nr:hypothetical protein [Actinomycetota bacterium]
MLKVRSAATALAILTALSVLPLSASQAGSPARGLHLTKEKSTSNAASVGASDGIGAVNYIMGGPIVANPNSYVIWYGNWDSQSCTPTPGSDSTASIINDLVTNIGDSPWNNINATYYQIIKGIRTFVSPSIKYSGCVVDSGSVGLSLDGSTGPQVSDVVNHVLNSNLLPKDPNGVYLVLTSSNVNVNGFLTNFCGYHSFTANDSSKILYAFVGDPSASLGSCVSQVLRSPNNNPAADGMASVLAHELAEPISDPYFTSWFDQSGLENADKCSWKYGDVIQGANGSFSNMELGGRKFLIQQNVPAHSNKCVSSVALSDQNGSGPKK